MKLSKAYWIRVLSAHGLLSATDFAFDEIAYPLVLSWFGNLIGGAIMMVASMVLCAGFLWIYERGKIDWLGVDAVEVVKDRGQSWVKRLDSTNIFVRLVAWIPTRIFLVVLWAIRKNDVLAFIALTLYEDAFKTTAFLRKGKFDSFGQRDIMIFLSSLVVSNVYWIVRWAVIIEVIKGVYGMIVN